MEIIIKALTTSAIWWVFVNYITILFTYTHKPLLRFVCWKCYTFLGPLLFTCGNLELAALASLISAILDSYLSNQKFSL